jgi:hypothetical protein
VAEGGEDLDGFAEAHVVTEQGAAAGDEILGSERLVASEGRPETPALELGGLDLEGNLAGKKSVGGVGRSLGEVGDEAGRGWGAEGFGEGVEPGGVVTVAAKDFGWGALGRVEKGEKIEMGAVGGGASGREELPNVIAEALLAGGVEEKGGVEFGEDPASAVVESLAGLGDGLKDGGEAVLGVVDAGDGNEQGEVGGRRFIGVGLDAGAAEGFLAEGVEGLEGGLDGGGADAGEALEGGGGMGGEVGDGEETGGLEGSDACAVEGEFIDGSAGLAAREGILGGGGVSLAGLVGELG